MWPFKKKSPKVEEMPDISEAHKLIENLTEKYKWGKRVKELNVSKDIYSELFDMGMVSEVTTNQEGNIVATLDHYRKIRLIVKI